MVDASGADKRGDVRESTLFRLGEGGAVSELGLEAAKFGDGAVEGAFVQQIESGDHLNVLVRGAGGEEGLGLVDTGDAHVPSRVDDLTKEETLGLAARAHVGVESFEELIEFVDFVWMDGELRGVDSVLAGV